jgi:hypothetical protein
MSGGSNVLHYLKSHGLPDSPEAVQAVLAAAKQSERLLTHEEIVAAVRVAIPDA